MCGVWLDIQIVYSSVPGLYRPMSPRTSIGFGMSRWLTIRWRTTTSAASIAASVPALSPTGPLEDDVVRGVLVELRRARLGRLLGVDDRRQRLPLDVDRLERVGRLLGRLGDDRGDALAGPLDAVGGQRARRVDVVLDARPRRRPARPSGSGLYGMSAPVRTATTPGIALAARRVDRADVGVGVRAAQDRHVGHPGQLDVVEVAALAGDEAGILDPLDRGAEHVGGHRMPPVKRSPRPARRPRPGSWPRPRGSPPRCCGSPCSGRSCPRSRGGSRRRSDRGCGRAGRPRP